jgi:dihydrofolate synthase/folylpolyglutamate synthase
MPQLDDVLARLRRLHPLLIDLSLGRIERLLAKLGNPQHRLAPVIHVAGTNGKGSVTAMLRAMLEAAGLRVHVYTSPHLVRFSERIVVASGTGSRSRPIAEDRLVELLERVEEVNGGDPMTFFEITTAAAFVAFAETPADAVILEVGLGGRLDATNVFARPRLTVITQVAFDHADKLGDTVAKIAAEKAGILKRGVTCVVARQDDEAGSVIHNVASRVGAPLVACGQDFDAYEQRGRLVFQGADQLLDLPLPALVGAHQVGNAGVAVAAALEFGLDERAIGQGLRSVELWLDGGHNPAGAAAIAETLAALDERAPKPIVLVIGLMGQKDARGVLANFRGLVQSIVTVPIPGPHDTTYAPEDLANLAREMGFAAEASTGVVEALTRIETSKTAKRILICGSLYLAGYVIAMQEGAQTQMN